MIKKLLLTGAFLLFTSSLFAADLVFIWNATTDPVIEGEKQSGIGGYKIHRGALSGVYNKTDDAGNNLTWTAHNVPAGTHFFAAVTAYDKAGNESGFSNEIEYTVPMGDDVTPPVPPSGTPSIVITVIVNP